MVELINQIAAIFTGVEEAGWMQAGRADRIYVRKTGGHSNAGMTSWLFDKVELSPL